MPEEKPGTKIVFGGVYRKREQDRDIYYVCAGGRHQKGGLVGHLVSGTYGDVNLHEVDLIGYELVAEPVPTEELSAMREQLARLTGVVAMLEHKLLEKAGRPDAPPAVVDVSKVKGRTRLGEEGGSA